jgi:hypothetical protein
MKLCLVLALSLLTAATAAAQTADSSAHRGRTSGSVGAKGVRTDRFIDTDGDGICDQRAQGLGFGRGKMGEGKMKGKNQMDGSVNSPGTGKQYRGGRK